jgi:hypothetical protein
MTKTTTVTLPVTTARTVWTERDVRAMLKGAATHGRGDKAGLAVYDSCKG